jgi:hypothetical protein
MPVTVGYMSKVITSYRDVHLHQSDLFCYTCEHVWFFLQKLTVLNVWQVVICLNISRSLIFRFVFEFQKYALW